MDITVIVGFNRIGAIPGIPGYLRIAGIIANEM